MKLTRKEKAEYKEEIILFLIKIIEEIRKSSDISLLIFTGDISPDIDKDLHQRGEYPYLGYINADLKIRWKGRLIKKIKCGAIHPKYLPTKEETEEEERKK